MPPDGSRISQPVQELPVATIHALLAAREVNLCGWVGSQSVDHRGSSDGSSHDLLPRKQQMKVGNRGGVRPGSSCDASTCCKWTGTSLW